jgi:hypothetical protein
MKFLIGLSMVFICTGCATSNELEGQNSRKPSATSETKLSGSCENQTGFFSFSVGLPGGESRLTADKFLKLPTGQRKVLELSGQVVSAAPSDQGTVFKLSQDSSIQYLTGSQNRLPLQRNFSR